MKRLILIRHAKSGWDDPTADDHDRVLTERGRKAAKAIGTWLAEKTYIPDVMLISDAARTKETHEFVCNGMGQRPDTTFYPILYHAAPDTILGLALRQTAQTIAVIAHNPGIAMAAYGLVKTRPHHSRFSDYPTCATTVIDFEKTITIQEGRCADFIVPRDLTD